MVRILESFCSELEIDAIRLPEGVRQRQTGSHRFLFNHNAEPVEFRGEMLEPVAVKIESII